MSLQRDSNQNECEQSTIDRRQSWFTLVFSRIMIGVLCMQLLLPQTVKGQTQERPAQHLTPVEVERRFLAVVRNRIDLTPAQLRQLVAVNRSLNQRRAVLLHDEREVRLRLSAALADSTREADSVIDRQLQALIEFQRNRTKILEDEQTALKGFLSARQRALYAALQERFERAIRRVAQEQP